MSLMKDAMGIAPWVLGILGMMAYRSCLFQKEDWIVKQNACKRYHSFGKGTRYPKANGKINSPLRHSIKLVEYSKPSILDLQNSL